jgi:hypothetical protein
VLGERAGHEPEEQPPPADRQPPRSTNIIPAVNQPAMYLPIVPILFSGCEPDEESVPRPQLARRVASLSPDSERQVIQGTAICTPNYRAAVYPCSVTSRTDAHLWPASRSSAPQKHGFTCLKQPPEYPDGSGGHLWRDPPLESVNCVTAAGQDKTILTGAVSLAGQSRPPGRHSPVDVQTLRAAGGRPR